MVDQSTSTVQIEAEVYGGPVTAREVPALTGRAVAYPTFDAWLEARRNGIGASDAAAILGVNPWTSPFALYCEKLRLRPSSREETEAMEWGKTLEPFVATKYQQQTDRQILDPGRFTVRYADAPPYLLATLDREIVGDSRGPGVLECKTCSAFKADEWEGGDAPMAYLVQLQHQLAVTGYTWGSLAVLIGGQRFRYVDVERNDKLIARLLEQEAEFWDRLLRQDPPPVDASEATADLLAEIYPRDDGHVIALPDEALEWDRARLEAIEAIEAAKARKTEAENKLRAALGAATKGIIGSWVAYSCKTQTRKSYTVAEATFRVLRRVKP